MELIHTVTRQLTGALEHVDTAALMPVLAVIGVVTLAVWLLARRKKSDRA